MFAAIKDVACTSLIFTIICATTLTLSIFQVHGATDPTVYLSPSSYIFDLSNASIGTRFNVTVKINDVSDLAAYQWSIWYLSLIHI